MISADNARTAFQTNPEQAGQSMIAVIQSALLDARRRLDSIDVKHRAGLSEDSLVDETLSFLVKCYIYAKMLANF